MTGLQSFLGGFGAASRAAASAAESPSPGANASHDLYTLRESDTPTSAESPPDSDVRHHRPRTHARTLGDLRPMTPGEAGAYASAIRERVEERPFESQPLLPRTPANNAAAASELGAEGDAQPAELGQPETASSPPVEPAEAVVAEAEASERLAGEQDFEAEIAKEAEGAEEVEIAKEAEGAEEVEIAKEAEGAEEVDEMEEEEVRAPRRGEKVGQLG